MYIYTCTHVYIYIHKTSFYTLEKKIHIRSLARQKSRRSMPVTHGRPLLGKLRAQLRTHPCLAPDLLKICVNILTSTQTILKASLLNNNSQDMRQKCQKPDKKPQGHFPTWLDIVFKLFNNLEEASRTKKKRKCGTVALLFLDYVGATLTLPCMLTSVESFSLPHEDFIRLLITGNNNVKIHFPPPPSPCQYYK